MIRILFICLGNICRSPMAEFVFKDMVERRGLADQFYIASAATSGEEHGISTAGKYAVQLKKSDYENYDYLIGMEKWNISGIMRIIGSDPEHKVSRLLDFSSRPRDIADPWYTGNFDVTYDDIVEGCQALLRHLEENGEIGSV